MRAEHPVTQTQVESALRICVSARAPDHSAVTNTDAVTSVDAVLRARIDLPTTASSVPVARRLVAQLLRAWSAETRHEESMLLLSELVTNVVRHVRPATTFTIELILSALELRVAVVDASTAPPILSERGPAGGHGMWLVSALADRWGSDEQSNGKQVWFELDQ